MFVRLATSGVDTSIGPSFLSMSRVLQKQKETSVERKRQSQLVKRRREVRCAQSAAAIPSAASPL
jgi:hypothetical protein